MRKIAVYDLKYCPITFDFVNFLAAARLYFAKKTNDTSFDLLIIADQFRDKSPRDQAFDYESKNWRIYNLLLPVLSCSPFVRNFQIVRERPKTLPAKFLLYPPQYSLTEMHSPQFYFASIFHEFYNGSLHPACFQAPREALKHAKLLFKSDRPKVIISPRYSNYEPTRNTNPDFIIELVSKLEDKGFTIGFIHDQEDHGETKSLLKRFRNIVHIPEASFNIPLRLALAEVANVNLFTPCALQGFTLLAKSHPNLICFDMQKPPNLSFTGDDNDYKMRGGMQPGKVYPYPWSTNNNIFIWDNPCRMETIIDLALKLSKIKRPNKFL